MRPIDGIMAGSGRDVAGERASSTPPPVLSVLTHSLLLLTVALQATAALFVMIVRARERLSTRPRWQHAWTRL